MPINISTFDVRVASRSKCQGWSLLRAAV